MDTVASSDLLRGPESDDLLFVQGNELKMASGLLLIGAEQEEADAIAA